MLKTIQLHATPILGPVPAKAILFAAPVVIHPQLAQEDFPACPVLPNFESVHDLLGEVLGGPADEQSYVLLDRIVSPSFLANVLKGKQRQQLASMLVCGHQLEQEDPNFLVENWIADDVAIETSKGVLGFLAGAVYRQEEDPNPIHLIDPSEWASSRLRRDVEALLSRGPSLLRHQVLAPTKIEDALMNGFEGLCRMYLDFHGGVARADADFIPTGQLLLSVNTGKVRTQFAVGAGTLPPEHVEQLLNRLAAVSSNPSRLPDDFEDRLLNDEPMLLH